MSRSIKLPKVYLKSRLSSLKCWSVLSANLGKIFEAAVIYG